MFPIGFPFLRILDKKGYTSNTSIVGDGLYNTDTQRNLTLARTLNC